MFSSGSLLRLILLAVYLPLRSAFPLSSTPALHAAEDAEHDSSDLWLDLGAAVALVLIGGVFAGLTIAYSESVQQPMSFIN